MRYVIIRTAAICCLLSLSCAEQGPTATPQPAPATRPATFEDKIPPDKLKADLDFLFKTIEEVHPNMYACITPDEFAKHRDKLYAQIDHPMDTIEFFKLTAPVVAKIRNIHTVLYPDLHLFEKHTESGGKVFPLKIGWDGQDTIVYDNHGSIDLPVGGTILAIDDETNSTVMGRICCYWPAEGKDRTSFSPSPHNTMMIWLEYGDVDSLRLRIKAPDGKVDDYNVNFITAKELKKSSVNKWASEANYLFKRIEDHNAGLIEFNAFRDLDKFSQFLKQTFKEIRDLYIQDLIIDLRKNPGGSSNLGEELLGYLTDKPIQQTEEMWIKLSPQYRQAIPGSIEFLAKAYPNQTNNGALIKLERKHQHRVPPRKNKFRYTGRTYVLISPKTGSSAVMFASYMKGKDLGTLIGQETIDTPCNYGEGLRFNLPHSNLLFMVPCKYFQCVGGKPDGRGVIPHHEVKPDVEDIARGVDTVLEYTLKLIRETQHQASVQSAPSSGS